MNTPRASARSDRAELSPGGESVGVSVIMIVRDGARFLAGAIESVSRQTRLPDEILVVDGQSTDATVAIAESYGVPVIQQPATGIADARNHGIARTTGRLVAFLDHDDRWLPKKLEVQVSALERDNDAGYSTTRMTRAAAVGGTAVHPLFERLLAAGPVRGLTPSTLMVRRHALEEIGPFDATLDIGCDMDWFARATDLQIPRVALDEVLVEKLLHDRNASINAAASRRDMLRVVRASVRRKRQHETNPRATGCPPGPSSTHPSRP